MSTVRYCNVHREDDKVTRWLADNWRPKHYTVWETVLARMINHIPSLHHILPMLPDLKAVENRLKDLRGLDVKVFTSAYTISTCGQKMDKIDYVMGVVKAAQDEPTPAFGTLAGTHRVLMRVKGLGSFLAAQVVADLKNTPMHPLQTASDWHTWAAWGPGSLRGLEAFYGTPITASQFTDKMLECHALTADLIAPDMPPIHMQDFQNCLCEFSKYMKVKYHNGHVRNRYNPGKD